MSHITYEVKVYSGGTKEWYLNGKRHREDGPAIEYYDGTKRWYLNGKCHREDGPAIEHSDGSKSWYLNGKLHREEEWKKKLQPDPCLNKIVEIEGKKYKLILVEK
jgi:antitoxin component YwqK of YwqJK toxin-antitoxin module